ncbi:MAG TPA: histidine phosphatase family protein [Bryobacteraceae bacterium]|nr:histidine phosphatase family protein [Bryobacteraceae bacterium]
MEIYLLRHGAAENVAPGRLDSERALTAEGCVKLERVLERARAANVRPGVILSSPYRRALQTAEAAAAVLGYAGAVVRTAALLPESSPEDLWEEIRSRSGETSILLAGHEPLMSAAVSFLLSSPTLLVNMRKAAMVRVDCEHFGLEPLGVLQWMLTPGVAGS